MSDLKTVALVPIKMNNERTPGKNTKRFSDGTPLIQCILKTLKECKEIDEAYVYCSKEEIKKFMIPGIHFLRRDEKYDTASADLNEMFRTFSVEVPADVYVLTHATAPFLRACSIDKAVAEVKTRCYDSALAVRKMQEFLWDDQKPVNYNPLQIPRTQDLPTMYVETTGLYVFTREVIQNKKCRIGEHPFLLEVSPVEATDINNPIDFEIASAIYDSRIYTGGGTRSLVFSPTSLAMHDHSCMRMGGAA